MTVRDGLLSTWKHETADLHRRAEQFVRILDPDAGRADYVRYLRTMHGYHAAIEPVLVGSAELAALGFDAPGRCRAGLAARDLAALGDAGPWPVCAVPPDASTLARQLGIAYVLEGSTLGGRYILSRLPPALAAVRGTATAFLDGYGADTGARWRSFGALAEAAAISRDEAVAGARDTFARLIDWLAAHEQPDARRVREVA